MVGQLCPWSGAKCCGCCVIPDVFPWRVNGSTPKCCQAWRGWTRQQIFVDKLRTK